MKIYLAAPFFSPAQLQVVEIIETALRDIGHEVFSPREGSKVGDSLGKTYEERKKSAAEIFKRNIDAMIDCDACVAVVDGSDPGTCFEIGWLCNEGRPIVSFTALDKALNIMLTEAVVAHCRGIDELRELMGNFTKAKMKNFQRFADFI